jgi:hypothetical protein
MGAGELVLVDVREPAELRPALERAIASTRDGRAALLEVMTHEESNQPEGS